MAVRLDLLAHGATAATRDARFPDDDALESPALALLEAGAKRFRAYDLILTSPALAARETARALGLDSRVESALSDCDFGGWRGLRAKDVARQDAAGFAAWLGDTDAAPHGGEAVTALIARTRAWLDGALARKGAILAITHAAIVRAGVVSALGLTPPAFWRIDIAPLSLVRLSGRDNRWNLVALLPWEEPA